MMSTPYDWCEAALTTIHKANWYRQVRPLSELPGPVVIWDGRSLINFASNDYLGLAGDARLIAAATAALDRYGTGSTGSRLLSGQRPVHGELERAIAAWKQTDAALVFSSGYLTNLGTISALVGTRDLILADQYNHSSLKNGARLSGAQVYDYQHGDVADLRALLTQHRSHYRRALIVTDSVFSMDGDVCPLPDLLAIAEQFSTMLLIDEAHSTGVFGQTGAGCMEHFGCQGQPLIQMGTLSKALGSLGGYVAGPAPLIDYLRNRTATWIYTTGLTPADTAAALAAIQVIEAEPQRLQHLWALVAQLNIQLGNIVTAEGIQEEIRLLPSASPIQCIQVPTPNTALQLSDQLMQQGIWVPAIRPPTVPTSRLRISVMATHTSEHLQHLCEALSNCLRAQ